MYHGFARTLRADDPHRLFLPVNELRAQLALLRARGWTALDLDAYLAAQPRSGQRSFLTTVDDGYSSVLHLGAAEFARAGVAPVLFVPPAPVADPCLPRHNLGAEDLLRPDELRTLADQGFELGVHGFDHQTMEGMSDVELRRHVVDARDLLGDLTGYRARAFAYPVGVFDQRAVRAVERAGYVIAFSVARSAGRHAIPRTGVASIDSLGAFRFKISPWYEVAWAASRPASRLRRPVRRLLGSLSRSI